MSLWLIIGLTLWILCLCFILAIFKGGHRKRGHGYEQKLFFRSRVNTQNVEDSITKETKEESKNNKESMSAHKRNPIRKQKGNLLKKVFETIRN